MIFMHKRWLALAATLLLTTAPAAYAQTTSVGGQLTNDVNLQDMHVYSQSLALSATGVYLTIPVASNKNIAMVQVTGLTTSTTGVLTIQDSIDNGVTWNNTNALLPGGIKSATISTDTKLELSIGGKTHFRFAVTALGTGTATISYGEASGTSTAGLALDSTLQTLITAINTLNASTNSSTPAGTNAIGKLVPNSLNTINLSGSITTGGKFQTIQGASSTRSSFEFQDLSGDPCYLYFGALASATLTNSIKVPSGNYYGRFQGSVPGDVLNVACTSAGDTFYAGVQ